MAKVLRHPRAILVSCLLFHVTAASSPSAGAELWKSKNGRRWVALAPTLKSSFLVSRSPRDALLFPDRWSAAKLFRLRLGSSAKVDEWLNAEVAYEQRARLTSRGSGMGLGAAVLPPEAPAPFRIVQLQGTLADSGDSALYSHELDRALLSLHPGWGEVTIGRQAIGMGRGVLFGAIDIFAPFSPTEVDREWRRGVDAFRLEHRVTNTGSVELLSAFGGNWRNSALLARARGYLRNIDGELIVGRRAGDTMVGAAVSSALGDAEIHSEIAVFNTPEGQPEGGFLGKDDLVAKAVIGSSYIFDWGEGLSVLGEYHYSGFGIKDMENVIPRLLDPVFQKRVLRGDTQILGRHALAVQLSTPFRDTWRVGFLILASPVDGSGLAAPSLLWDAAGNVTVAASGFLPWGSGPVDGRIASEYGTTPSSLFLQLNLYF